MLSNTQFIQLVKFAIIGVLAATVHLSVLTLFVEWGHLSPLSANVIAFICAFITSYVGQRFWTFANAKPALGKFFLVAIFAVIASELGLYLLHYHYGIHYLIAILLTYTVIPFGTFLLNKHWVFNS